MPCQTVCQRAVDQLRLPVGATSTAPRRRLRQKRRRGVVIGSSRSLCAPVRNTLWRMGLACLATGDTFSRWCLLTRCLGKMTDGQPGMALASASRGRTPLSISASDIIAAQ